MRKITIILLITILIAGTVSAQGIREERNQNPPQTRNDQQRNVNPQVRGQQRQNANPQNRNNPQQERNSVTVDGTLKLERGIIAVESGDTVYFVPMLNRYTGFIASIREGARVSIEGFRYRNMIQPTKLTVDGRSYDFPAFTQGSGNFGQGQRWNNHGNQGPNRNKHNPKANNNNNRGRQNRCRCCGR